MANLDITLLRYKFSCKFLSASKECCKGAFELGPLDLTPSLLPNRILTGYNQNYNVFAYIHCGCVRYLNTGCLLVGDSEAA